MYELRPNNLNVYDTLRNNYLGRNSKLIGFLGYLNNIESSRVIAIDGKWGSGKTFFIKQIHMILSAYNDRNMDLFSDEINKEALINYINPLLDSYNILLNPVFPVYYDAWKNDSDLDPLLSILYEIINTTNNYEYFREDENLGALLEAIYGVFKLDFRNFRKKNFQSNIIDSIKSSHEVKNRIISFFKYLSDKYGKIIIFIDELDRCKPDFALQLLERIKHYFDIDNIIFVLSMNIEQIQFPIRSLYGGDFDSTKYLYKFYDDVFQLESDNLEMFYRNIGFNSLDETYNEICKAFIKKYNFQYRDIIKYSSALKNSNGSVDLSKVSNTNIFCRKFLLPIVIGLRIYNNYIFNQFIVGAYPNIFVDFYSQDGFYNLMKYYVLDKRQIDSENIDLFTEKNYVIEQLKSLYNVVFSDKEHYETSFGSLKFYSGMRKEILNMIGIGEVRLLDLRDGERKG